MARSVHEKRGPRKKKLMGTAEVVKREEFERLQREDRIKLIKQLIPLGLMAVAEELEREVDELVGPAYVRSHDGKNRRYGSNPGSVILGNQRIPIRVPRVRNDAGEVPLQSYDLLHSEEPAETLYQSILQGVSCRGYEETIGNHWGSISKSKSTTSRRFVEASSRRLKELQNRNLSKFDVVALFLDGTPFADDQMVIALGVTSEGRKVVLGFVQTGTENTRSVSQFLGSVVERGLGIEQGILAVTDGSKGLISALRSSFRGRVMIQRCQWHKRENIVSYLSKSDQAPMRQRLQHAYERPTLEDALKSLSQIEADLLDSNQSAASSLREGFDEVLSLHKLGLFGKMGRSFKPSNCLESLNATAEKFCGKVDYWKNSSQKQRWLASALLEIEPNLRRVQGYQHLDELRGALKRELKL